MELSTIMLFAFLVVIIALQIVIIKSKDDKDFSPLLLRFDALEKSQQRTELALRNDIHKNREEATLNARLQREEVSNTLNTLGGSTQLQITSMSNLQKNQLDSFAKQLMNLREASERKLDTMHGTIEQSLQTIQTENNKRLDQMRAEAVNTTKLQREEITSSLKNFNESVTSQLNRLTDSNEKKLDALRGAVEGNLKQIQDDNAKQLEQMRNTVDEKLQGTLEKRLGESFKQVSERLEQVHRGLGEMQILATGVGDLKKVLTNVKARGTWGEIQLERLLEQILTPEQYQRNVRTNSRTNEVVEFAIKLPGRGDDERDVVWLPIDSKFPIEDYHRLVEAQENGNADSAEAAGKMLVSRIKACAKEICEKYLCPPQTTDFGIMFLPTEGLYAEVIRRIDLVDVLQREFRVIIAGPTTFAALLNSLQMGFRTLAIQKRSSEVWNLLGAVKTEFGKFGDTLDGVKKRLDQASTTMDEAAKRSRAIERKLRNVQELPAAETQLLLTGNDSHEEVEENLLSEQSLTLLSSGEVET
ncbi:DNA recombination protein RmuC [candidate division KSB1 bacterium]|nr:DNA recombination protein RmuC [candidate division KSB1 bacterium]